MCFGGAKSNKELEAWNNGERRWEETWRSFIYKSSAHRLIKRSSAISACIIFINHFEEWLATHLYNDDCNFPLPLNPLQALFDPINALFAWGMDYGSCFKTRLWFLNHYKICSLPFHNRDTLSVFTSWWLVSQAQIRSGPWLKCFNCLWMFKTRP